MKTRGGETLPVVSSRLCGLDMGALTLMAPAFGIEPDQTFFEKLRAFESAFLSAETRCNEKKKEACLLQYGEYLEWTCARCEEKE